MKLKLFMLVTLWGFFSFANATVLDDMTDYFGKAPKNAKLVVVSGPSNADSVFYSREGKYDSIYTYTGKVYFEFEGDIVRYTVVSPDGTKICATQTKDSFKTVTYSPDGVLQKKVLSSIDKHHEPLTTTVYDADGKVLRTMVFKRVYDAKGRWIKAETFDANGTKQGATTRKFNGLGVIVEKTFFDADGNVNGYAKYDSHGNPIEEKDNFGMIYATKYKYDSMGNWVEKSEGLFNSSKSTVYKKQIFYY